LGSISDKEVNTTAKKSFKDLTSEEKQARYDYAKDRRKRLATAMRSAGIIGVPKPKMSEEERKGKRKEYSRNYHEKIKAESDAYRELMAQEMKKVSKKYRE
jgi:hypothetical protein